MPVTRGTRAGRRSISRLFATETGTSSGYSRIRSVASSATCAPTGHGSRRGTRCTATGKRASRASFGMSKNASDSSFAMPDEMRKIGPQEVRLTNRNPGRDRAERAVVRLDKVRSHDRSDLVRMPGRNRTPGRGFLVPGEMSPDVLPGLQADGGFPTHAPAREREGPRPDTLSPFVRHRD